jgi:two-component system, NarL family, nitrate/nitrite response regulator NarL
MSCISVALIDDHPLMIEAVCSYLSRTRGFKIVGTGASGSDIVEICKLAHPNVAIVGVHLNRDAYLAIAKAIQASPATKLLVYTSSTSVDTAIRTLDAGASGYVLKAENPTELIQAIWSVQSGQTYITKKFSSQAKAGLRDPGIRRKAAEAIALRTREREIIRLLMRGKTNKEIAIAIKISEKTVEHHVSDLMQKLQVRNRLQAVIAAQNYHALNS